MKFLLIVAAVAASVAAGVPPSVPAMHPLPVWLESISGPPETLPPGMPFDGFSALLHAYDHVWGTTVFSAAVNGTRFYTNSENFDLYPGESLPLVDQFVFTVYGDYVMMDSVICRSHGDSSVHLVWDFHLGPRHHGGIGIARVLGMPSQLVDTFWSHEPKFELANYGSGADSGWAFALFRDTAQDRVVYTDSLRFSLASGQSQELSFRPVRFHSLGPHLGTCGWRTDAGDADSLSWRFDVRILQHGDIAITQVIDMPFPGDTIDTLRTWSPKAKLKVNYAMGLDSLWLVLRFSDSLIERIMYADSYPLVLTVGQETLVDFRSVRFTVPGPYHGQLGWHCMHGFSYASDWDFWVDAGLGVSDAAPGEWVSAYRAATVVCGMLYLRPSPFPLPMGEGPEVRDQGVLLDATGRKVMNLLPGPNDVRHLAPGIHFVRQASRIVKVIVTE